MANNVQIGAKLLGAMNVQLSTEIHISVHKRKYICMCITLYAKSWGKNTVVPVWVRATISLF